MLKKRSLFLFMFSLYPVQCKANTDTHNLIIIFPFAIAMAIQCAKYIRYTQAITVICLVKYTVERN